MNRRIEKPICSTLLTIGWMVTPIFLSYRPPIVSKVLQMGLSVRLFIQTFVLLAYFSKKVCCTNQLIY